MHGSTHLRHEKATIRRGLKGLLIIGLGLLLSSQGYAQSLSVGDNYSGGIVYRVDKSGHHGWIVSDKDVRDSVSYNDALKMLDTVSIGGARGWKLPSSLDWDTFDGQPGIISLVIAKKLKFEHLYYWTGGSQSSTSAEARTVAGDFHQVAFYRERSKIALRLVRKF